LRNYNSSSIQENQTKIQESKKRVNIPSSSHLKKNDDFHEKNNVKDKNRKIAIVKSKSNYRNISQIKGNEKLVDNSKIYLNTGRNKLSSKMKTKIDKIAKIMLLKNGKNNIHDLSNYLKELKKVNQDRKKKFKKISSVKEFLLMNQMNNLKKDEDTKYEDTRLTSLPKLRLTRKSDFHFESFTRLFKEYPKTHRIISKKIIPSAFSGTYYNPFALKEGLRESYFNKVFHQTTDHQRDELNQVIKSQLEAKEKIRQKIHEYLTLH